MFVPVLVVLFAIAPAAVLAADGAKASVRPETLVHLRSDGSALVRGAEVTAVSGDTVTAQTSHGDTVLTWTIDIDSDTEIVTNSDEDFDLSDIDEGDTVSFSGELTSAFRVEANVLKEWSDNRASRSDKERTVDFRAQMNDWFSKHFSFGFWKK